ncbi:iron-containing alcohol dehydrogenase [Bacillus sp. 3255]|uniref:iron-containing alcohol dehydrogenase family protein n=1 Tax=Bacillus sp. 3255 TaxID=2817904 RepID=UPI00285D8F28|nr:iron-containing alcohol dehydrogenase [Bacillus sp. 3255]MDR6884616.1 glycerol dehydrogenase-like iron-containing ADH family enzyme [Bacillus sp. 3255]
MDGVHFVLGSPNGYIQEPGIVRKAGEWIAKFAKSILFSGMVGGLGEDNCRSAAAHAIHNGLTVIPETHEAYHGEKVAYGILVQVVLEDRSKQEIKELCDFYRSIGLPLKLNELGIHRELSQEELNEISRISLLPESTMGNMNFPVTSDMIIRAIRTVESF